jgi:EAL domain-containing protein (putative c-di-GMP-specific phosphodiesterase class I)
VAQDELPTYHERLSELAARIEEHGSLGVMVLDASELGVIEAQYGLEAHEKLRARVVSLLREHHGREYRQGDFWALDQPGGLRLLLFLERKRRKNVPFSHSDFKSIRARLLTAVVPVIVKESRPYLKQTPRIDVSHGLALANPLVRPERIIARVLDDAAEMAAYLRAADDISSKERLQDLIVRERVLTAFQPILLLKDRTLLGSEALSRGARGTGLETASALFGTAEQQGLLVELDRLCRVRALLSAGRLPSNSRVFVNTLPATIRDPTFRRKPLIDFLDRAQVSPDRIVIEITERLVIENYAMFRDAMGDFVQVGMSFAVDDVGAGYSGLEAIASLHPHFLKIDMALVRNVHTSVINQAMVKAIVTLSRAIGATVIAEGIQSQAELDTLDGLGVDFGQGYFLAKPDPGPE